MGDRAVNSRTTSFKVRTDLRHQLEQSLCDELSPTSLNSQNSNLGSAAELSKVGSDSHSF